MDPEPDWFIVWATQPGRAGQKPKQHELIIIHPKAVLADLAQLGDAYRRKYGVPRPGQRLGVRITPFTSGFKGVSWTRDVFVTA